MALTLLSRLGSLLKTALFGLVSRVPLLFQSSTMKGSFANPIKD